MVPQHQGDKDEQTYSDPCTIALSAVFYPQAGLEPYHPDVAVVSSDQVFFYVHRERLLSVSFNKFDDMFPVHNETFSDFPLLYSASETADVMNIVFHVIYGKSCSPYSPSFDTLILVMNALRKYGVPLQWYMSTHTELFALFLSHATFRSIEGYAIAAENNLDDLAVAVSSHLLSFQISSLTNDMANRIGAVYLKRLVSLHQNRMDMLRSFVFTPPEHHSPTVACTQDNQSNLYRAWALGVSQLVWEASPGMLASSVPHRKCLTHIGHRYFFRHDPVNR